MLQLFGLSLWNSELGGCQLLVRKREGVVALPLIPESIGGDSFFLWGRYRVAIPVPCDVTSGDLATVPPRSVPLKEGRKCHI